MSKYEAIIRYIGIKMINREKELAKHHMKRLLKHYDELSDVEKEVVDEQRIVLFS